MSDKIFRQRNPRSHEEFITHISRPLGLLLCLVFIASSMRLAAQTTPVVEGTVLDTQGGAIVGAVDNEKGRREL